MKIKKFITAATCAALITAAALPLTACGAKSFKQAKEFDISKYAQEIPTEYNDYSKSSVKVTEVATGFNSLTKSGSYYWLGKKGSGEDAVYSVYNQATGKLVADNLKSAPTISGANYIVSLVTSGEGEEAVKTYTMYGSEGTKLIDSVKTEPKYETISSAYVNGESKSVVKVTGKDSSEKDVVKYFQYDMDTTRQIKSYTEVAESSISFVSPDLAAGSSAYSATKSVQPSTAKKPVEGDIKDYSYTVVANEYVFSKNGEETGRVNVENIGKIEDEDVMAFVGNYMYYTIQTELPENSKKADLVKANGSKEQKYNYEIHRYDIVKNKDVELGYNDYIYGFMPLYNYEAKAYDAVAIAGYKVVNDTVQTSNAFLYVANAELEVAYDVTASYNELATAIKYDRFYKLGDNKFAAVGNTFATFNEKLEPIASISGVNGFYASDKVVVFRTQAVDGSYAYGYADYDGKIVAAPTYSSIGATYGGKALVTNVTTGKKVILSADGTETALPEGSNEDGKMVSVLANENNGWYVVRTITTTTPSEGAPTTSYKVEIFDYSGTLLKTYESSSLATAVIPSDTYKITVEGAEGADPTYTLCVIG